MGAAPRRRTSDKTQARAPGSSAELEKACLGENSDPVKTFAAGPGHNFGDHYFRRRSPKARTCEASHAGNHSPAVDDPTMCIPSLRGLRPEWPKLGLPTHVHMDAYPPPGVESRVAAFRAWARVIGLRWRWREVAEIGDIFPVRSRTDAHPGASEYVGPGGHELAGKAAHAAVRGRLLAWRSVCP